MQTNKTLEIIEWIVAACPPAPPSAWQAPAMTEPTAERWCVDAGDADVALLDIPPHLSRTRRFEVDVRFVVQCPAPGGGAWHALTVELDGRQHWSRRIATSNPGQSDSLDYHCRVEVPAGAGLRVRALARTGGGAQRRQLRVEAEES
jgi:hypothetical protein